MALGIYIYTHRSREQVMGLISPAASPLPVDISADATLTAQITIATVSAVPAATETALIHPTEAPKPKTKPTPTLTPKPTPEPSQNVNGYIDRFSAQYSVDPNLVRAIAICESGFNSSATNNIYVGLFQFGSTTWSNIRKEMGEDPNPYLRFSAKDSVQTAAYSLSKGKGGIWPNCYNKKK